MKVGIITCVNCMTCMFAFALTMGGPIRRQASQSEKTVPIGGNVTLLCPFVTDDTLEWIYWQKNNHTIYARSQTTTTNDTKYEGITSYATPLTIKDFKKTDRGIYHCKVSTSVTVKEGGRVMISVTEDKTTLSPEWARTTTRQDQEGGLFTTSPGFPLRTSSTIPSKPAECNTITLAFSISTPILIIIIIIIIIIIMYWKLRRSTSTPLGPESSPRETREKKGTGMKLLNRNTNGRDDVDDRPRKSSTSDTRETQLPLVGPVLIDDLRRASTSPVSDHMSKLINDHIKMHGGEDSHQTDCKYSFLKKKYDWCIPEDVLDDAEYFLDALDHIPVGRKRDVCEILLTMPKDLPVDPKGDIFREYDQGGAIIYERKSRSKQLGERMRNVLTQSATRDAARNFICTIILKAPVDDSRSASSSQHASSTLNTSANKTKQNTSVLSQRNGDLVLEDNNLIKFWLSKVIKLKPAVQRDIRDQFGDFKQDAGCSYMENTTDPPIMQIHNAEEFDKINMHEKTNGENAPDHQKMPYDDAKIGKISNLIDSTVLEPQPPTSLQSPLSNSQLLLAKLGVSNETEASQLMELIEKNEKEKRDKHEEKATGCLVM